ncbi:hypothetical protein [Longispora albida]|uniref:hypothetical protein n=1 Tax=Longispora albida TaxID=203523 RepID=UPI000362664E|nr:hypothetical protein [Longispora albida]
MEIRSCPEAELPGPLLVQVRAIQEEAWPSDPGAGPAPLTVHDPVLSPRTVLLLDGGTVLAALDILTKEIEHGGHRYQAGGLSTVVTAKADLLPGTVLIGGTPAGLSSRRRPRNAVKPFTTPESRSIRVTSTNSGNREALRGA